MAGPHGPLVFGTEEEEDTPNGPIFSVTSDDESLLVTDPGGPTVNLEVNAVYASIELALGALGPISNGIWIKVPFNVLGPVEVLGQLTGTLAAIGIPEDQGGDYDCELSLCFAVEEMDGTQLGIETALTTGGSPDTAADIPASHGFITNPGTLPFRACSTSTVLVPLVDLDLLQAWVKGTNPFGSDDFVLGRSSGSMEAVRLKRRFPV